MQEVNALGSTLREQRLGGLEATTLLGKVMAEIDVAIFAFDGQKLLRVLGHELNNSLAPIQSMVGSLDSLLTREPRPADWQDDLRRGLKVIGSRAEALRRFLGAYARLARLPSPQPKPLDVDAWIRRVVGLETRLGVTLMPGPGLRGAAAASAVL